MTPKFWTATPILNELNFGLVQVYKDNDDTLVLIEIRDADNRIRLSKTINVNKELQYTQSNLRYNKMC